jgi:hypothetical protein
MDFHRFGSSAPRFVGSIVREPVLHLFESAQAEDLRLPSGIERARAWASAKLWWRDSADFGLGDLCRDRFRDQLARPQRLSPLPVEVLGGKQPDPFLGSSPAG